MIESLFVNTLNENFDSFFVIDVREEEEYNIAHIKDAMLAPLSEPLPAVQNNGKAVVFMCRSGKRSLIAAEHYQVNNQSETVYNLVGGILAWQQHGYPVIS
ncbi:MAG TPA: rhodanese-like domain-containing protein [Holosporales bacterium]|nr:rhodanese-like domain-containing protein [Holosporales bacterium]